MDSSTSETLEEGALFEGENESFQDGDSLI